MMLLFVFLLLRSASLFCHHNYITLIRLLVVLSLVYPLMYKHRRQNEEHTLVSLHEMSCMYVHVRIHLTHANIIVSCCAMYYSMCLTRRARDFDSCVFSSLKRDWHLGRNSSIIYSNQEEDYSLNDKRLNRAKSTKEGKKDKRRIMKDKRRQKRPQARDRKRDLIQKRSENEQRSLREVA